MFYVYWLKSISRPDQFYIGSTDNVPRRVKEHNTGLTTSTKRYMPWRAIYLEGYANEEDARDRESKIKQFGKSYSQLKRRIRRSLMP